MSDAPDAPVARETEAERLDEMWNRARMRLVSAVGNAGQQMDYDAMVSAIYECVGFLRAAVHTEVGGGDLASLAERLDDVSGWQEGILRRMTVLEAEQETEPNPRTLPVLHEVRETDVICCCGDHLRPTGSGGTLSREAAEQLVDGFATAMLPGASAERWERRREALLAALTRPASVGTAWTEGEAEAVKLALGRAISAAQTDAHARLLRSFLARLERGEAPTVGPEVVAWRWRYSEEAGTSKQWGQAWSLTRLAPVTDGVEVQPLGVIGPVSPGDPIAEVGCPCCGAALCVEHGDEEGEVVVVGVPVEERAGTAGEAEASEPWTPAYWLERVDGQLDVLGTVRNKQATMAWLVMMLRRATEIIEAAALGDALDTPEPGAPMVEAEAATVILIAQAANRALRHELDDTKRELLQTQELLAVAEMEAAEMECAGETAIATPAEQAAAHAALPLRGLT